MDGISLFYTDLDRAHVEIREIAKMGSKAVDTNALFIDNLPVPKEDLIGEEGKGFYCLLDGLNPERILIASKAIGFATAAPTRPSRNARGRAVFQPLIDPHPANPTHHQPNARQD